MKFKLRFQLMYFFFMLLMDANYGQNDPLIFLLPSTDSLYQDIKVIEAQFNNDSLKDYALLIRNFEMEGVILGKIIVYYGNGFKQHSPKFSIYGLSYPVEYCNGLNHIIASDLNADGFDDLVTGTNHFGLPQLDRGFIQIVFSRSDGLGLDPNNVMHWYGRSSYGSFAAQVEIADVTSDNISDLIVTARFESLLEGETYIYYGGVAFDSIPDKTLYSTDTYGLRLVAVDDFNGDKISDVLLLDYLNWRIDRQRLHLFFGKQDMNINPDARINIFNYEVSNVFDFDNDGRADILLQKNNGQIEFVLLLGQQNDCLNRKQPFSNRPKRAETNELKYELKFLL